MESFLSVRSIAHLSLTDALKVAALAWAAGHLALADDREGDIPQDETLLAHLREQVAAMCLEAAVIEADAPQSVKYRTLADPEVRAAVV